MKNIFVLILLGTFNLLFAQDIWLTRENPTKKIDEFKELKYEFNDTSIAIKLFDEKLNREYILYDSYADMVASLHRNGQRILDSGLTSIGQSMADDSLLSIIVHQRNSSVIYLLFKLDEEEVVYELVNKHRLYRAISCCPERHNLRTWNLVNVNTMERFSRYSKGKDYIIRFDDHWGNRKFIASD